MIVYRTSDRLPLKIGPVTFWFSPLSFEQKSNLLAATKMQGGVEVTDSLKQAFLTVKYSIKKVDGIQNADGSEYQLELDHSGVCTDEAASDLLSLGSSSKLVTACASLANEIKEHKIPGVEINIKGVVSAKKKD